MSSCVWKLCVLIFIYHTTNGQLTSIITDPLKPITVPLKAMLAKDVSIVCFIGSVANQRESPIENSDQSVGSEYLQRRPTYFFIAGYNNTRAEVETYVAGILPDNEKSNCNTCFLNWEKAARAIAFRLNYPFASIDGGLIAEIVGENICTKWVKAGMDPTTYYLKGHSEGAHICCNIGRKCQEYGYTVNQVVALDAAMPSLQKHVNTDCAKLVRANHVTSDFGTAQRIAHIDIYLNYACYGQPGCAQSPHLPLQNVCSHMFILNAEIEAMKNRELFMARRANNLLEFRLSEGIPGSGDINYMGPNFNESNHGAFYLCTSGASPFGKGVDGTDPKKCSCYGPDGSSSKPPV